MEDNRKKVIVPLIVGILCMFILLGGATYAYFVTNTTNSFGTKTITGQADATGSVALIGTNASLYLNLDRTLMAQGENDITYWAVTTNTAPSTTENVVTVGSTSVNGAGYFNCNYTLNVAASGTNNMYTAFQGMSGKSTDQIVLNVGGNTYDFNTASLFPITVNGTLNGVTSSSVQNITAEFYLKNKSSVNQRDLAGTDLTLTITATSFTCTQLEDPNDYLDKNVIINEYYLTHIVFMDTKNVPVFDDECISSPLTDVSQKQNGSILMSIDSNECMYDVTTIYIGQDGGVKLPPDSSHLFESKYYVTGLNKLDTSHVTDMSYMFANSGSRNVGEISSLDVSTFDTSNVLNMEGMFDSSSYNSINVSNWNTSKVTNMRNMFSCPRVFINSLSLTSFDTSNVVDMFAIFSNTCLYSYGYGEIDLSSFSTSNVTNMRSMFAVNYDLSTIFVSNQFSTLRVETGGDHLMFESCHDLVGGNGTSYANAGVEDSSYARIDAPGTPGYFTLKN